MKKTIEYETMMDLLQALRSDMKLQYDLSDYDKMLASWQRAVDYINSAPTEITGASLPKIKFSRH